MLQREKRKKKTIENLFNEITAENFLSLGKDTDIQVQETQSTLPPTTDSAKVDSLCGII